MDGKELQIRQDLIWGVGASTIENITEGEFNTDPDTINTDYYNYLKTITYPNGTHTIAAAISSGQNKKKPNPRKNIGENWSPSKKRKTGTNTENTQKLPTKQKYTYRKTNTKKIRSRQCPKMPRKVSRM